MAPTVSEAVAQLLGSQNSDGGWGYGNSGGSWTEPTALALLAVHGVSAHGTPSVRKAVDWLQRQRRSDGGWSPNPDVRESTWVTSLALLAFHRYGKLSRDDAGFLWLMRAEGAESTWTSRLRQWMLGGSTDDVAHEGWPWFPGAAAWVAPTALTIVALQELSPLAAHLGIARRIASGRNFLIHRRCADGGWNHGSSRALGYDGDSYPETTGLALLALRGESASKTRVSIDRALAMLPVCRSPEGWSWLQMGLRAHGVSVPPVPCPPFHFPGPREAAVCVLAGLTVQGARMWGSP